MLKTKQLRRAQEKNEKSEETTMIFFSPPDEEDRKKLAAAAEELEESYRKLRARLAHREARMQGLQPSPAVVILADPAIRNGQIVIHWCARMGKSWTELAGLLTGLLLPDGRPKFDPASINRHLKVMVQALDGCLAEIEPLFADEQAPPGEPNKTLH